jgi:uncharacterized protein (DUF488 family)
MKTIYTIGHSTDTLDVFLNFLRKNKINTVIDVRSVPYSRFANQFNKEQLEKFLKKNNIYYIPMGKSLGARFENKELLFNDGKVNFSKVIKTDLFLNGIARIEKGINQGFKITLMCSEKNPLQCHRFSLLARFLHQKGYKVAHIVGNDVFDHKILEKKMINYYMTHHKISLEINKIIKFQKVQRSLFIDEEKFYTNLNKLIAYSSTI